jgi:ribosomal protein S19E (S16A)
MKNKPVTAEDVYAMFPNKFRSISRTKESMAMLEKYNLVKKVPTGWVITKMGADYLQSTAKTYKGDMK